MSVLTSTHVGVRSAKKVSHSELPLLLRLVRDKTNRHCVVAGVWLSEAAALVFKSEGTRHIEATCRWWLASMRNGGQPPPVQACNQAGACDSPGEAERWSATGNIEQHTEAGGTQEDWRL